MLQLVFTAPKWAVARLVRSITGGRATHIGLRVDDNSVIYADHGLVVESTFGLFLLDRVVRARFEPHPTQAEGLSVERLRSFIGRRYDCATANQVKLLSYQRLRLMAENVFADDDEFFCAAFAVVALQSAMACGTLIQEFQGLDEAVVTPARLLRIVKAGRSFLPIGTA